VIFTKSAKLKPVVCGVWGQAVVAAAPGVVVVDIIIKGEVLGGMCLIAVLGTAGEGEVAR
jgi:hypothetical protein